MGVPKQMTGPAVTTKNTFCVRSERRCCVYVQRAALGWLKPARHPLACSQACVTAQQRQPTAEGLEGPAEHPGPRPGDGESTDGAQAVRGVRQAGAREAPAPCVGRADRPASV